MRANLSGQLMVKHPRIMRVSMTGSTGGGKAIMRDAGAELKSVTLELGGNDPAIVLDDVDVKQVAQYVQRLFSSGLRLTVRIECSSSARRITPAKFALRSNAYTSMRKSTMQ